MIKGLYNLTMLPFRVFTGFIKLMEFIFKGLS